MRLGYALLFDDETHNYVRQLQLALAARFGSIMALKITPHITVKAPFASSVIEPYEEYLDTVAREYVSFPITGQGVAHFDKEVLYIPVEASEMLLSLHGRIISDMRDRFHIVPERHEKDRVIFHVTLALDDVPPERADDVLNFLQQQMVAFRGRVAGLALCYYVGARQGWMVYRQRSLSVQVVEKVEKDRHEAVICDLDGTLALLRGRGPYEYDRVGEDALNISLRNVINTLYKEYRIILLTGREDVCRKETERWLVRHHVLHDDLLMRRAGDYRKDTFVKKELHDQYIKHRYSVALVFDDRKHIVALWQSLGYPTARITDI